jgi:hypothetical protein
MKSPHVPRVATWLLGCLLPPRDREAVLGDLIEEYAIRAGSPPLSTVARWYWWQVSRSIPQILWSSIRREGLLSTLGVAFGAYIAAGLLEFAGVAAISKLLGPNAGPFAVLNVVIGLATMVLGGYVAAWIRPGAASALAGMVMIAVVILMVTMSDSAPLWYGLTFLIVGPLAALAGGTLYFTKDTRRAGRTL